MSYSPILSIVTALFEICAVVWTLKGPGRKSIVYTVSALLLLLAGYQIMEVIVCMHLQGNPFLARLAFIIITWLPPTTILLVAHLYPSKKRSVYRYAFTLFSFAFLITIWILVDRTFVTESVCTIIFARFLNPIPKFILYCVFYQTGLLSMLFLSALGIIASTDPRQRYLLGQVLLGSLAFIIPAIGTVMLMTSNRGTLPSIMCHYALFFAIFLVRLIRRERCSSQSN